MRWRQKPWHVDQRGGGVTPRVYLSDMRLVAVALLLAGCAHEPGAHVRTAHLREAFPAGDAKSDVRARLGEPSFSATRPDIGWSRDDGLGSLALEVEGRTGGLVWRAEKHVVPDVTSTMGLTLSHIWCFYDRSDDLLDIVWERMGD
jgi:hypothetical protein